MAGIASRAGLEGFFYPAQDSSLRKDPNQHITWPPYEGFCRVLGEARVLPSPFGS